MKRLALAALLVLFSGCPSPAPTEEDAGSTADAGPAVDAGTSQDAGAHSDGGTLPVGTFDSAFWDNSFWQ